MSELSQTIIETKHNYGTSRYRIVQETAYHEDTPDRVILILERAKQNTTRIKITFGDLKTGKVWEDVPISCYIGRSTGRFQIPLAIHNRRSCGGPRLLDHCIVKIEYANKKNGTRPLWDIVNRGYSKND